jgi:hypothetical protein
MQVMMIRCTAPSIRDRLRRQPLACHALRLTLFFLTTAVVLQESMAGAVPQILVDKYHDVNSPGRVTNGQIVRREGT